VKNILQDKYLKHADIVRRYLYISEDLYVNMCKMAKKYDVTKSEMVNQCIKHYYETAFKENKKVKK
jgi:hypothetical protein